MFFARYIGPKRNPHNFVPGGIYLASPWFSDSDTAELSRIRIEDNDKTLTVEVENGEFDFPETVFAVVLKKLATFEIGHVVEVCGLDIEMVEVCGKGFFKSGNFEILDTTNVSPGGVVFLERESRWARILSVDDSLNISIEGGSYPVTAFRFAVGEGVVSEPLWHCLSVEGAEGELGEGKAYRVKQVSQDGSMVFVENDQGEIKGYLASRFQVG